MMPGQKQAVERVRGAQEERRPDDDHQQRHREDGQPLQHFPHGPRILGPLRKCPCPRRHSAPVRHPSRGLFPVEPLGGVPWACTCAASRPTTRPTSDMRSPTSPSTSSIGTSSTLGHEVRYVQNLTDVDDDMLAHARERGRGLLALGTRDAERFQADMDDLNWLPPDVYARPPSTCRRWSTMIERLLAAGLAYQGDGHVYLSAAADPAWGSLSHVPPGSAWRWPTSAATGRSCPGNAIPSIRSSGSVRFPMSRPGPRPGAMVGRAGTSSARR